MDQKRAQFHTFLNDHIGIIRKLCRGYANSEEDFEDYVQEVCYQLWKSLDNFRGEAKAGTWVYRITLNVCLYMLKKEKKIRLVPTESIQLAQVIEKQKNLEQRDGRMELLYESITSLKPIDRAIIMLYLDKKEHAEIAEIVGLSVTNVGVRINRIKKQLKKSIHERTTGDLG